jgi:hypothetical protein
LVSTVFHGDFTPPSRSLPPHGLASTARCINNERLLAHEGPRRGVTIQAPLQGGGHRHRRLVNDEMAGQSFRAAEHNTQLLEAQHAHGPQVSRHRQKRGAAMVPLSPLRLVQIWREQQQAKRTDMLAERILAVMRRRQADARSELLFSTELLTKLVGADPASVFRALGKLERDRLISRDDMAGRCTLADKPMLKR